eukprot:TRINITY_DN59_c0_g1_i2.p1 TRINITY_DN59_c0_g1~~TRINITY_DN59_c0_g1_i2.p1  ORF type:complete len:285 (+),score=61.44 TRINITY_DN59_c0_g1_i2:258-1112(+)
MAATTLHASLSTAAVGLSHNGAIGTQCERRSATSAVPAVKLTTYEGLGKVSRLTADVVPRVSTRKTLKCGAVSSSGTSAKTLDIRASCLPLVGNKAPDFEATAVFDQEFIQVKLSDYQAQGKYVVLFFYPLDFTFVCPTEITAFSDRHAEFAAINTEVLGVSVDSVFSHLAWIQTERKAGGLGDLAYPLVSDITKEVAKLYNVLIEEEGVALRGLFIIDREGIIQHATINNLAIGRSVDETLRTLQAVQYVQENPDEVCPAGWKPGEKSMKPDPKGSKEYFAAI